MRHYVSLIGFLWLFVANASVNAQDVRPVTEELRQDVQYLASEELKGRGTDSDSIDIAAKYLSGRMTAIGLDTTSVDGDALQPLTITFESKAGPAADNQLAFAVTHPAGGPVSLNKPRSATMLTAELGIDMNPMAVGTTTGNVNSTLAFVGFGITAPELGYDDYAGINVDGKVVVILRKEPNNSTGTGPFSGNQNTRHAFFITKIRNAIAHGAAAVILVSDTNSIKEKRNRQKNRINHEINRRRDIETKLTMLPSEAVNNRKSFADSIERINNMIQSLEAEQKAIARGLMDINDAGSSNMVFSDQDPKKNSLIPVVTMTRTMLNQLLVAAKASTDAVNRESTQTLELAINQSLVPHSFELPNVSVHVKSRLTPSSRQSSNVIGVFEGKGSLANETVVLGAHYDHVGMGRFGSLAPDTIAVHNGADDNASGTAVLLAVAKQLTSRLAKIRSHRRLVVIAFTGEEVGLLGSKHYVRNPRFPLESTVAMINLDMVGRLRDNELTVYGTGSAKSFDSMIESANTATNFKLYKVPTGYGPSDHQSFYEVGIPVLFFFTGLHSDYHRPTDDFDKIDFIGMTRITDMVSECSFQLAVRSQRPEYAKTERSFRIRRQEAAFIGISLSQRNDQIVISAVTPDGPAKRGGIQVGDFLIQMDGNAVQNTADVLTVLRSRQAGETITVEVSRRQQKISLPIKLAHRP